MATAIVGLTTEETAQLQKNGSVKLSNGRVRSLKYDGNQYDSAEVVKAAKSGQLALVKINKAAGGVGYVLTGVSVASDIYEYQNGDLSQGRFIYRSTGNAAVITLAIYGSGGTAAVVGIGLYSAEKFYDIAGPYVNRGLNSFDRNMTIENIYEGVTGKFYEDFF